ncbi:MAG: hypothetical protein AAGF23_17770 [Acidobacteriota bacterium]
MTTTKIATPPPRSPRSLLRLPGILRTLLFIVSGSVATVSVPAATLTLGSALATVTPGETVTITATVSGLGAAGAPSLGTFDVTLFFDPALVGLDSGDVSFSDSLGAIDGGEAAPFVAPGGGSIEIAALSVLTASQLDALQGDTFQLFEAEFRVSGSKPVTLTMAASALGDGEGSTVALDPVAPLDLDVADGVVFADGFEDGTTGAWTASVP